MRVTLYRNLRDLNLKLDVKPALYFFNNLLFLNAPKNLEFYNFFFSRSLVEKMVQVKMDKFIVFSDKAKANAFYTSFINKKYAYVFYMLDLIKVKKDIAKVLNDNIKEGEFNRLLNAYKVKLTLKLKNNYELLKRDRRDSFSFGVCVIEKLYKSTSLNFRELKRDYIYRKVLTREQLGLKLEDSTKIISVGEEVSKKNLEFLGEVLSNFFYTTFDFVFTAQKPKQHLYFFNPKKTLLSNKDRQRHLRNVCFKYNYVYLYFFRDYLFYNTGENGELSQDYFFSVIGYMRVFLYLNKLLVNYSPF